MWVLVNGELAHSVDVPNFEVLVHGSRGDLSVIWGESNGKDILGVTEESLSGGGSLEVPESDGSVPGGGKAESRVLGKIDVGDEVGVSGKNLSGLTPFLLVIGISVLIEIPDHEGLVSGSGDKELSVDVLLDLFLTDLDAGDPSIVALEETSVTEFVLWLFFSHCI